MARNQVSGKSNTKKMALILVVGFLVAAGGLIVSEVQSSYLRTAVVPTTKTITPTDIPNTTTKKYQGDIFQFTYPDNWEITSGSTEFHSAGTKISVGNITLYSFPYPLNPGELEEFRTSILKTNDIVSWTGSIGSYPQATYWAKNSRLGTTTAPTGPRFILLENTTNTIAILIPEPSNRSQAVENILESLNITSN